MSKQFSIWPVMSGHQSPSTFTRIWYTISLKSWWKKFKERFHHQNEASVYFGTKKWFRKNCLVEVWGYKWGYGDFRFSELFEAICALLFQLRKGFKMLWKNWKVEFRFLRDRIDYQTVSCCVVIWRSTIARRQDTANVKEIGSGTFHSRPVVLVSVR